MKYNKRTFIIVGLVLGLLFGVMPIIIAYMEVPSLPGPFELGIQILIVGFWGAMGLALGFIAYLITGFIVYLITTLFRRKRGK